MSVLLRCTLVRVCILFELLLCVIRYVVVVGR